MRQFLSTQTKPVLISMGSTRSIARVVVLSAGLLVTSALQAQFGPVPVSYTEARTAEVRSQVVLPGTVEARRGGVVSSEIAGLVIGIEAREGDRVAKGAPLARLRRKNLDVALQRAQAERREAEARLELAKRRQQRSEELFSSGVISRQELDDASTETDAWTGRVEQAGADIAALEDDLEQSVIRAPFGGVVVSELTEVGEWIAVGGQVVELIDLDRLEVRVDVPERNFAAISKGDPVQLSFESVAGLKLEGEVSARVPKADARSRTFPMKVAIDSADERVGVGMLARVAFAAGSSTTATIVPKDAVVTTGGMSTVYRLNLPDSTDEQTVEPEPVAVEVGAAVGSWVSVSGIAPGEHVITRGNERLAPGMQVAPTHTEYEQP